MFIKQNGNWVKGIYKGVEFEAKIFQDPSHYGINGGRVSKLWYAGISYERGWDHGEDKKNIWLPLVAKLEIYAQSDKFSNGLGIPCSNMKEFDDIMFGGK